MVAKLIAVCMALILCGGVVQAADHHAASTTAVELSIDLDNAAPEVIVPVEPILALPVRHDIPIDMPPVTQLITYTFAPRMDRPPRN